MIREISLLLLVIGGWVECAKENDDVKTSVNVMEAAAVSESEGTPETLPKPSKLVLAVVPYPTIAQGRKGVYAGPAPQVPYAPQQHAPLSPNSYQYVRNPEFRLSSRAVVSARLKSQGNYNRLTGRFVNLDGPKVFKEPDSSASVVTPVRSHAAPESVDRVAHGYYDDLPADYPTQDSRSRNKAFGTRKYISYDNVAQKDVLLQGNARPHSQKVYQAYDGNVQSDASEVSEGSIGEADVQKYLDAAANYNPPSGQQQYVDDVLLTGGKQDDTILTSGGTFEAYEGEIQKYLANKHVASTHEKTYKNSAPAYFERTYADDPKYTNVKLDALSLYSSQDANDPYNEYDINVQSDVPQQNGNVYLKKSKLQKLSQSTPQYTDLLNTPEVSTPNNRFKIPENQELFEAYMSAQNYGSKTKSDELQGKISQQDTTQIAASYVNPSERQEYDFLDFNAAPKKDKKRTKHRLQFSRYSSDFLKYGVPDDDQQRDYAGVSYQKVNTGDDYEKTVPKSYSRVNVGQQEQYVTSHSLNNNYAGTPTEQNIPFSYEPAKTISKPIGQNDHAVYTLQNQQYVPEDFSIQSSQSLDDAYAGQIDNVDLQRLKEANELMSLLEKSSQHEVSPVSVTFKNSGQAVEYTYTPSNNIQGYNYIGDRLDTKAGGNTLVAANAMEYYDDKTLQQLVDSQEVLDQLALESAFGDNAGQGHEGLGIAAVVSPLDGAQQTQWIGLGNYPSHRRPQDVAQVPDAVRSEKFNSQRYRGRGNRGKRPNKVAAYSEETGGRYSSRYRAPSKHKLRNTIEGVVGGAKRPGVPVFRQSYRPKPLIDSAGVNSLQKPIRETYYPVRGGEKRPIGAFEDALAIQGYRNKNRTIPTLALSGRPTKRPKGRGKAKHTLINQRNPEKDFHIYVKPEFPALESLQSDGSLGSIVERPVYGTRLAKKPRHHKRILRHHMKLRVPMIAAGSSHVRYVASMPKAVKRPIMFRQKRKLPPRMRRPVMLMRDQRSNSFF